MTVGTLLCTGAAARSERTASTGAWRESSDDTGREARSARLKEAAMERGKKTWAICATAREKNTALERIRIAFSFLYWKTLRSLLNRKLR